MPRLIFPWVVTPPTARYLGRPRRSASAQPTRTFKVNWRNPLARGLVLLTTPTFLANLVDGRPPVYSSNINPAGHPGGTAWSSSSGGIAWQIPVLDVPHTVLSRCAYTATNNRYGGLFSSVDSRSIYHGYSSAQFAYTSHDAGHWYDTASGVSGTAGQMYTLVGTASSATDRNIYVDGVWKAQDTRSSGAYNLDQAGLFYRDAGTIYDDAVESGQVFAVWNRVLSASEIALVSANPWQLFTEDAPAFFVFPGGGDTPVSISIPPASLAQTGQTLGLLSTFTFDVGVGGLTLTGQTPGVSAGVSFDIPPGALTLAGQTLGLTEGFTFDLGVASLTLTGQVPGVGLAQYFGVGAGSLTLTGQVPSIGGDTTYAIGPASLVMTGQLPSLTIPVILDIGVDALSLTGQVPTITFSRARPRAVMFM